MKFQFSLFALLIAGACTLSRAEEKKAAPAASDASSSVTANDGSAVAEKKEEALASKDEKDEAEEPAETQAKSKPGAPFEGEWADASADEKAAFLEVYGESRDAIQKDWDKASPELRKKILSGNPLLFARALKHHWVSATPEERAAFLEAHPKTAAKIKKGWDEATPDQRRTLSKEHPYFARKAMYHTWMEATPREKVAFLGAFPKLHAELHGRWSGATKAQKQWYAKNYPGLNVLVEGKTWGQTSPEERALFLDANPNVAEKARDAWQKTPPEKRADIVRQWAGWPLRYLGPKTPKVAKASSTSGSKKKIRRTAQ